MVQPDRHRAHAPPAVAARGRSARPPRSCARCGARSRRPRRRSARRARPPPRCARAATGAARSSGRSRTRPARRLRPPPVGDDDRRRAAGEQSTSTTLTSPRAAHVSLRGVAGPRLVAGALAHGQARIARKGGVGLRALAQGERGAPRVAHHPLVAARVAQACGRPRHAAQVWPAVTLARTRRHRRDESRPRPKSTEGAEMLPGPRLTEEQDAAGAPDPRAHAARDRCLARDRSGLVRGRDRCRSDRPTITSCATSERSRPGSGIALLAAAGRPSWRVPILFAAFARSALHTVNHLFDIGGHGPRLARARQLRRLAADRRVRLPDAGVRQPRAPGAARPARSSREAARVRVFLAGATGVIGRRLLPRLLEAGHDVTAMTRREDRAAALREAGAMPVVCDVFDAEGLRGGGGARAARGRPARADRPAARRSTRARWRSRLPGNDRIRTEGTRNLVAAAVAGGRAAHRRAEHRVRVRADGRGPEARGRPALGRRAVAVVAQRARRCTSSRTRSPRPRASRASCCATASSTAPARRMRATATSRAR